MNKVKVCFALTIVPSHSRQLLFYPWVTVYKFDGYCSSLLKNIDGYIYGLIERQIES